MKNGGIHRERRMRVRLWLGLIAMVLLSPLGLLLPRLFKAEEAWGEWGPETLQKLVGFIPQGLKNTVDLWKAPLTDYSAKADHPSLLFQIGWYVLSAFLGTVLIVCLAYALMRYLAKRDN